MKAVLYNFRPDDELDGIAAAFPQLSWAVVKSNEAAATEVADADILVLTNRVCSPELAAKLNGNYGPNLKWIHFVSAGIERGLAMDPPKRAVITHSPGVKAKVIAEHAVTLLLATRRRLAELGAAQREHRWARLEMHARLAPIRGGTICIIGMGALGRAVARRLKAFECTVVAVSRAGVSDQDFDMVYRREQAHDAYRRSTAVVVCTSSEPASKHMLDQSGLAVLPRGSVVVNVARGEIIDEAALIEALQSGHLGGAGLDVTDVEPLPAASPLWDLPNVVITPHVSGGGTSVLQEHKLIFAENLEAVCAGRRPPNLYQPPS